ncbi:hypothetical protein HYN49_12715 [Flavobacterium pallidum]|uniref:Bulb-type lectin domain-containing protein n=2 Tax=Flavobacterium pallidum TaxID=2172098 RepID=A0A2S1SK02_9FLAO|nr:hypothetical protein HYN49_12715 [Flavobacterium pallidum]
MAFAQVPQGISYQAIALNAVGQPVASANVGVRLSILDDSASGTVLYTETQIKATSAQGLFTLVIGQGTPVTGTFSGINWGMNSKFLKVEMDVAGGTNYAAVGTTQLLSVPYAMYAGNTASVAGNASINDDIVANKNANFGFIDTYGNNAYVYNVDTNAWSVQPFNVNASPTLISSKGNFFFIDTYDNKAYCYYAKTGTWSFQAFNENASPSVTESNGNFGFVDTYDNKAYVYNAQNGTWSFQEFNMNAAPSLVNSKGSFGFVDTYDNKAYVFNRKNGAWSSQSFNVNASPLLSESNGNFAFVDTYDNKAYIFNGNTGSWTFQQFDENASPSISISETN